MFSMVTEAFFFFCFCFCFCFSTGDTKMEVMYISEKEGDDASGDGSEQKPVKTLLQAMKCAGGEPFPKFMVDAKKEGEVMYCRL